MLSRAKRALTACGLATDGNLSLPFKKIVIANRGEIACRVIRTCKELGVKTVAVYSDADAAAMHTRMADESWRIGPPPAAESYLLGDKIINIAKNSGAEAIHPGYGFLSENVHFAEKCAQAGIVFIGPPVQAIRDMGSKSASKNIMEAAGVPCVPGYHGEEQSLSRLNMEADRIGYPVMIKAVLGGGGKGMRICENHDEFEQRLSEAKGEAMSSFADDVVLLERYIKRSRHIEFQIFGDHHGSAVHLFERDCSVQRRNQKVLEEAPAFGMTSELRQKMGKSAVDAAKAVGYVGAGTVEFIVDADTGEYFFMEMNTRLQVEHPVTEMVMGQDLVEWQLHVAKGNPLPLDQGQIGSNGYAIEARIYAENPSEGFLPSIGRLDFLRTPKFGSDTGVRVETGIEEGDEVSVFYDPMIAKLVTWGPSRDAALKKMTNSLEEFLIVGPETNVDFLRKAVHHKDFASGNFNTSFIPENEGELLKESVSLGPTELATAALYLSLLEVQKYITKGTPWASPGFRINHLYTQSVPIDLRDDVRVEVRVTHLRNGSFHVQVPSVEGRFESTTFTLGPCILEEVGKTGHSMTLSGDITNKIIAVSLANSVSLFFSEGKLTLRKATQIKLGSGAETENETVAPMPGKIVEVVVTVGQTVKKGDLLLTMEAMKMRHSVKAGKDGTVDSIAAVGDFVEAGQVCAVVKES